jgi:hypothetical protein
MSIASGSAFGVGLAAEILVASPHADEILHSLRDISGLGEANIFIVSGVMEEKSVGHLHLIGPPDVLVPYSISPECMMFLGRRFIEGRSYV